MRKKLIILLLSMTVAIGSGHVMKVTSYASTDLSPAAVVEENMTAEGAKKTSVVAGLVAEESEKTSVVAGSATEESEKTFVVAGLVAEESEENSVISGLVATEPAETSVTSDTSAEAPEETSEIPDSTVEETDPTADPDSGTTEEPDSGTTEEPVEKPKKTVKTGLRKARKNYYFYNSKGKRVSGKLKNGTYVYKKDGVTYYLTAKKKVEAYKKKGKYYYPNGKKMGKMHAYVFETELRARKIAAKITKKSMTKAQKLRACFNWVMAKYYSMPRRFSGAYYGWPAVFANDHFINGHGDCHSDAAAFAYLAKAIGYKKIYVCNDSKGFGHSWCEINGLAYDPLFAQVPANGGFSKNYGVKYSYKGGPYREYPVIHTAI